VAPLPLADEQVLEVDAVAAGKGGVVQEPDRDRDNLPVLLHHVREHRGIGAEEFLAQVLRRRLDGVRHLLVLRQAVDAAQDPVFIAGPGPPQDSSPGQRPALARVHRSIIGVRACQYVPGRVRGSPKRVMTSVVKQVMAVMWSPAVVMTWRP